MIKAPLCVALTAAVALAATAGLPATTAAAAAADDLPTAIVSLGDSYVSGEADRWRGNANNPFGSRNHTDRAYADGRYDPALVYPGSYSNGCHRADVAEVISSSLAVDAEHNVACSGARTANVIPASSGGAWTHGEPPQADQLARIAERYDIELVILSIGGNDLGFSSVLIDCAKRYTLHSGPCAPSQQRRLDAHLPETLVAVGRAIDGIRAVLAAAGQPVGGYRLVLQTYPSPIPRASENRYSQSDPRRTVAGRCPFYDADSTWARDSLVPQLATGLAAVATAKNVELLDLRDALQGREVCARASSLVGFRGPAPTRSEWTRFIVSGIAQGQMQESMHPNAYAMQAFGRCLTLLAEQPPGQYRCGNTPGGDTSAMVLTLAAPSHTSSAGARPGRERVADLP